MTGGDSLGENPKRDDFEYRILSSASENQVPVIGICRGMQLMASSKGVSVTSTHSHAGTTHEVFGENNFMVNSYHNFCLRSSPEEFIIDYRAADGSVEAFSNQALNWYGVMWHPEREEIDTPGYNHLLDILEKL
jgi:putative glutamine amidotransferase